MPDRRPNQSSGQSLAEFAVIAPLFILVLLTLFDFGRVVYAWNAITNNAREAARVGSVSARGISGDTAWQARYGEIRAAAGVKP